MSTAAQDVANDPYLAAVLIRELLTLSALCKRTNNENARLKELLSDRVLIQAMCATYLDRWTVTAEESAELRHTALAYHGGGELS